MAGFKLEAFELKVKNPDSIYLGFSGKGGILWNLDKGMIVNKGLCLY